MKSHEQAVFRFADFVLIPSERLLLRAGRSIALTGKAFDLLVALVEGAGHLMTKDALMERVWPGVIVEEVNLSMNVSAVRKALGDAPGGMRWIETVARKGYRFNAPVAMDDVSTMDMTRAHDASGSANDSPHASRRRLIVSLACVAGASGLGAWWWSSRRREESRSPTPDSEAYQAYVQGRYLWNQRSEESLMRAARLFARATELDPAFAAAYSARADVHSALGYLGYASPVASFPIARPFALKALELDPTLANARAALGYLKLYFDWDWRGAGEELRRAVAMAPSNPTSRQWLSIYLLAAGQPDDAFREINEAHRLEPLSLAINTDIGFHHYYAKRHEEAVAQLRTVLGMKEDFTLAHLWLARTFVEMGRIDDAFAHLDRLEARLREWPVLMAARGYTLGIAGRTAQAHAVLAEMKDLSKRRFVTAYGVGLVHAGLGETDEAFAWLEKAFEERSHWLVWLRLDPRWKRIRGDPRFGAMLSRMNFP